MKGLKIAVDIDGVLRDFVGQVNKIYAEDFPKDVIEPVTAWDMHQFYELGKGSPKLFWEWVFQTRVSSIMKYAPFYLNSREMLDHLAADGHHICLLTTQPIGTEEYTTQWLRINQVVYHSLVFSKEKHLFNFDIILDDGPHNLTPVANYPDKVPVCFDRPWNKEWKGLRVRSYDEFETLVGMLWITRFKEGATTPRLGPAGRAQ